MHMYYRPLPYCHLFGWIFLTNRVNWMGYECLGGFGWVSPLVIYWYVLFEECVVGRKLRNLCSAFSCLVCDFLVWQDQLCGLTLN
jgi:hypothetical protein